MPDENVSSQTPEHANVSYEARDAWPRPVLLFGASVILLGVVAHFICLWMFDALRETTALHDPGLPALAAKERPQLPQDLEKIPPPRLQVEERLDLEKLRQAEDARLNSYGWADAKHDKVRIPIAEAMRLLANPEFAKDHGIRVEPAKNKGGK
jgi:hypothetical protein